MVEYDLIIHRPQPGEDPSLGLFRARAVPRVGETVTVREPRAYEGKVAVVEHRPAPFNTTDDPAIEVYLDPA